MLINTVTGDQKELSCFEPDSDTETYFSCFINWKNQLFIFGGENNKRQISQLTGHRLKRVGHLLFDHDWGACSVMANKYIFLCFNTGDSNDSKLCRRSTGPFEQFTEQPFSTHDHTRIPQTSCSESKFMYLNNKIGLSGMRSL